MVHVKVELSYMVCTIRSVLYGLYYGLYYMVSTILYGLYYMVCTISLELSLVEGKGAVITLDQFNQLERSILNNNKCLDKVLILHDVCMERNAQDIKEENVLSLIR